MSESPPTHVDKSFRQILEQNIGKEITIINPESFEETAVGHRIQSSWYQGKMMALGEDFVVVVVRFPHGTGKDVSTEPVEQYIPLSRVKRFSVMHSGRYLHI